MLKLINTLSILFLLLVLACTNKPKLNLPYFGLRELDANGDTIYHSIPDWNFVNQDGKMLSQNDYKNKVYVADFFFTSCPTICPKMTSQLKRLQHLSKDLDVQFISYSVDPKRDSVERLKWYVEKNAINTSNWNFFTGNAEVIYDLGMNGYYLSAMQDENAPGGFLHSQMLVLVDKEGHIRGMYDGTSNEEVDQLFSDLKLLLQDYE